MAREFHVLPSEVARALDRDPDQTDVLCVSLLHYARAKAVFDQGGKLDAWSEDPMMRLVAENDFAEAAEALGVKA